MAFYLIPRTFYNLKSMCELGYSFFIRFAEKNNLPKLEYVSLPRAGAMKVIMEEIGPDREPGASTSNNSKKGKKTYNIPFSWYNSEH